MTSADVRARLTHALRLDLIGPEPGEPQESELLRLPPSRWYLTGFLVPWNAPSTQKSDEDEQGELEMAAAGAGAEDDDTAAEPPAAKRGQFPSSMGISLLVPPGAEALDVTARWGDYEPLERDGRVVEWKRTERSGSVSVSVRSDALHVAPVDTRSVGPSLHAHLRDGVGSQGKSGCSRRMALRDWTLGRKSSHTQPDGEEGRERPDDSAREGDCVSEQQPQGSAAAGGELPVVWHQAEAQLLFAAWSVWPD